MNSDLQLDEWVMPSHMQIARVLDGGLDAAIAWAVEDERLHPQLLRAEPLDAVVPVRVKDDPIAAARLRVLVDADVTSWRTWNAYVRDFAAATGARIVEIDDGGVAGPTYRHARRLDAPVLQGAKRDGAPMPAGLRLRPVVDPTPLWCWSLVTRADDNRPAVLALRENAEKLTHAAGLHVLPNSDWWVPPDDPHRDTIAALSVA